MAAYAAVISLKQTIDRLLPPFHSKVVLPNSEMKLIFDDLCYLQSFLATVPCPSPQVVISLEKQIKDVIYKLEDTICSHVSGSFLSAQSSMLHQELLRARQHITSLTNMLMKVLIIDDDDDDDDQEEDQQHQILSSSSSDSEWGGMNKTIGMVDELIQLLGWLEWNSSGVVSISVVGMAGIGKTTLVKQIYYDSFVAEAFPARFFISIGPRYRLKKLLRLALSQAGFHIDQKQEEGLGPHLRRYLKDKRYLLVLDDVWDTNIWSELKPFFPDDNNGSRVILTTTLVDVGVQCSSYGNILRVPFLDDNESWDLLQETILLFITDPWWSCDPKLEKIGKKIAKNCEGLPLAIVAMGELLSKTEKTLESWKAIAENENSLVIRMDDDTPISRSLSPSYKQLPPHLKVCFLYMGVFPKGYVIYTSKVVKLWVAEGLVEPRNSTKSLEETAMEYLDDLVSKSVLLVEGRGIRGGMKTCKVHFVFRNLCVDEARNEELFYVIKKYVDSFPEEGTFGQQQRLCIQNNVVLGFEQVHSSIESVSGARSLLCFGPQQQYPVAFYLPFRLLKVLDALAIRFYEFPHQVTELLLLRYLAITYDAEIPSSISCLWNLEVLIVHRHHRIKSPNSPVYLPIEIWKLHKLKHLQCMGSDLPDPGDDDSLILEKLLTLSGVSAYSCNRGVLAKMPSLMKLGILIESMDKAIETFGFLGDYATSLCEEFESFKCVVINPSLGAQVVPCLPSFPINIRKITLSGCGFPWDYMRVIAKLPNLVVLKLRWYAFSGPKWETIEEKFRKLKFLLLEDLDIQHWETYSESCFPQLSRLVIKHCYRLQEIPRGIADTSELRMIEVEDCSSSLVISARKIYREKHDWVNDHVQIMIHSSWDDKKLKS